MPHETPSLKIALAAVVLVTFLFAIYSGNKITGAAIEMEGGRKG